MSRRFPLRHAWMARRCTPSRKGSNFLTRFLYANRNPLRLKTRWSIGDLLLVTLENVVEIGRDRKGLSVFGEVGRRDVGEQLVPGRLVELAFEVLGVDARIPVELLDDAVGLDLGAGSERDEFLRQLALRRFLRHGVV